MARKYTSVAFGRAGYIKRRTAPRQFARGLRSARGTLAAVQVVRARLQGQVLTLTVRWGRWEWPERYVVLTEDL